MSGDASVEQIVATREELRERARAALGVTGEHAADVPPLRATLRRHGLGLYPLVALGTLMVVDQFHGYAFTVLAPDIAAALGIGKGAVAGIIALKTVAIAISPLPMAAAVQHRPRRALLAILVAFLWALGTISNTFVISVAGLVAVLLVDGLTSGAVSALHYPLLLDSYPPEGRVRALSYYAGAERFGAVLSPLLVAFLGGVAGLSWRGIFLAMGGMTLLGAVFSTRLRDPGFGNFDTKRVREQVHEHHGESGAALAEDDVRLGFFEITRRLFLIPTVRRLLYAQAIFGVLLIPYQTFLLFFLEERWHMGVGERGLFFAATAAAAVVALALFGRRGERMFREDPATVVRLGAWLILGGVVLIAAAGLSPVFWVMYALFSLSSAILAILNPAISITVLSIIPAEMRPHAAALLGLFLGGVGGTAGAIFLGGIDRRYGVVGSIVALLVPGVVGALVFRSCAPLIRGDLDRMIDEVIEDEEVRRITGSGGHLPMLACRGVDFSYGQLQVLFDVDFTVDEGEMVALLGVNGAGKSTLLRVVSGLGLPTRGSVRFHGQDVTYLDAERRTLLGITQIPGGRAVFDSMNVVENLRLFAHSLGRDHRTVEGAIERSFEAFPRLADRRNQRARTLSGGEQQMLALTKALMLRPRLLLIDELSLGLAPVIVEQLLAMVRTINDDGTAVVLVEQSVNVALSLVDHAYFMEKGEVRFDGSARELLGRDDLLRAVFLDGVGGATTPDAPGTVS
ncbi:MAG TPA: MFS transporter [Egicoccus sp.]|nr:MFS transporter [Egicoccus sp.]HSK24585.1 MFS transporter [Egicoccus sp.]